MSTRSVIVRLEAEVTKFVLGMQKAEDATKKTTKASEELGNTTDTTSKKTDKGADASKKAAEAAKKHAESAEKVGTALTVMGAATVAALGATAKAAMDWESAWAGVTKTVDGSPEQMAALEGELRNLAKTLPSTHTEIAAVAEAAGQLGVAREDVTAFTKTMIDLSETTNLSADEAATSIAQFMNVMGTSGDDVDKLGSTLVALGNDGASTEKDIISMAQRISGAGKLVGASEADILALSNALASVGIQAELGGGVTSRVLQRMYADVTTGGEGLQALADVAGTSSQEFADAFKADPIAAMDQLVKGFERVKNEGGNVVETMKSVGIKGTEETGVILRLAGAGDLLSDSLALGSQEWETNLALVAEADKRYATTEAQVSVAWNNIKDASIDAGASILPVVAGIAESVSGLAQVYGSLPAPVQSVLTGMVGVIGVTALVGGAALTLIPKIRDTRDAFKDLNAAGSKIPGTMGKIAKGAAAAGAIAMVGVAIGKIAESTYMDDIDQGMGRIALAAEQVANGGPDAAAALDRIFTDRSGGDLIGEVDDIDSALRRTFDRTGGEKFNDWGSSLVNDMTGIKGSTEILEDSWKRLDTTMADLVNGGDSEKAAEVFGQITAAAAEQGISLEDLNSIFPGYKDSLDAAAASTENTAGAAESAATAQQTLEDSLGETGIALDGVVTDMEKFLEQLFSAGMLARSEEEALSSFEASIDGIAKSIETNGKSLDLTTEKGRANAAAFRELADNGQAVVETMAANGSTQEQLQTQLTGTYDSLIVAAGQFGITGDKADAMARKVMGIPDNVKVSTWMSDEARKKAAQTQGAIDKIDRSVTVTTTFETKGVPYKSSSTPVSRGLDALRAPGKANGGDLDSAPGPKGVDSQLFYGAKGEHVFTDDDVDAMGGQAAVYRFRASLHSNVPAYANGGGIGASPSTSLMATNRVALGPSAERSGPLVDMSGSNLTALDPVGLQQGIRREIMAELRFAGLEIGSD